MTTKKTLLLLTDFSYQAKGRDYSREDVELSIFLRQFFNVCISHIDDIDKILPFMDVILLRNTGPQISHQKALQALRKKEDLLLFNDLKGKGDLLGKSHLLELFESGFPVIPSFGSKEMLVKHELHERYFLKPLDGADSCGVKIVSHEEVLTLSWDNALVQPLIDFQYELSFYFIGEEFHYALYAPDPHKRWELKPYNASKEEIDFALQFIHWNTCKHGIQRVDCCRLFDGSLLLMELEDYNPFLSLDLLPKDLKESFLMALFNSLNNLMEEK